MTYTIRYSRTTNHIEGVECATEAREDAKDGVVAYYALSACGQLTKGNLAVGGSYDDLEAALKAAKVANGNKVCKNCEKAALRAIETAAQAIETTAQAIEIEAETATQAVEIETTTTEIEAIETATATERLAELESARDALLAQLAAVNEDIDAVRAEMAPAPRNGRVDVGGTWYIFEYVPATPNGCAFVWYRVEGPYTPIYSTNEYAPKGTVQHSIWKAATAL